MNNVNTMQSFLNRVKDFVAVEKLFSAGDHLLLAVSGGLDSVVLCDVVHRLGCAFSIAHCNFKLREEESERDEVFVRRLAEQYNVKFFCKAFDTIGYAEQNKCSIQEAARQLRYEWFGIIMDKYSLFECNRKIRLLTAHHLDDNIETLLMNFFKGTGIAGLRGMSPSTEKVKRPFLFAKRLEIEKYAVSVGLNWVEDSSNLEDKYSRNFFRHQVIPLVEKIFPQAIENLSDNLGRFRDIEKIYLLSVEQMVKKLVILKGEELHIPVEKLRLSIAGRTLVYEIISRYGFHANQVDEVMKLIDSQTGKYVSSATHRIIKNRNWLIIALNQTSSSGIFLMEEVPSSLIFQGGKINLNISHPSEAEVLSSGKGVAYLNAVDIRFPLILRKWKTGDYFYPLGMRKKKKISRFLIDLKKSKIEKENTWVLESDKRIVWVAGERLDDRFKWTPAAKIVFRIVLETSSNS